MALAATTFMSVPAFAERVLRLDEVAVGELDPALGSDYADSILAFNVYDTLVIPVQGGPGMAPHLAEKWEGDGTSFSFTLRKDVKFTSGNAMTADDVVFSFNRMMALGQGNSFLFLDVEKAEAVDAHTVKFTLKAPYSPFISSLTRLPIIDKTLVMANLGTGDGEMKDWGKAYLTSNSAGTGAYKVVSHDPQNETVMAKNPTYFLPIAAEAPDTVRLRYGLDPATVRTLISTGEHDISSQWLPPEVKTAIAAGGGQLLTEGGTGGFYFKINTKKAPFDDINCRRAIVQAYDYTTGLRLVQVTGEIAEGKPASGAVPAGMMGAGSTPIMQNLEGAKASLAACKYPASDFKVQVSWIAEVPIEERFALLMQANLSQIGVQSEIVKQPWALFSEQVSKPENTPHISQLYVNSLTGDPDTLLYGMYHSKNAGTWQSPEHLSDADVDAALDTGRSAVADADRAAAYNKLNTRLNEVAATVYGYDSQAVFAASTRVKVPAMTDPAKAFGLDGMGFTFRLMEVAE